MTRWKEGDRVVSLFRPKWQDGTPTAAMVEASLGGPLPGVLAEYRLFPEDGLVRTPDTLTDSEASTLPIAALTAWFALVENGRLAAGETVVLQGTGGVSLFGLQIAKALGARTLITTGSASKRDRLQTLGADAILERSNHEPWEKAVLAQTGGRGADHIIEVAGGANLQASIHALTIGGHIALVGFLAGKTLDASAPTLMMKQGRIWGVAVGHRRAFERMLAAFAEHSIHPIIDQTYAFDQIPEAFQHLSRGAFGKLVIQVAS